MRRKTLVSVGLPFYNPGAWLEDAIRSVFSQTLKEWELLLVDDGSTDGSYSLCKRIKDPRVRCFRDGKRLGLAARLNQIATLASGEYLARLDADDLMRPNRLEEQVQVLESNANIGVVATGTYLIDQRGGLIGIRPGVKPTPVDIFAWGGFLHPSITGRITWFRANPYSELYPRAEDRELFVRVMGLSHFEVLREPLYFYRWYGVMDVYKLLVGYRSERVILLKYGPLRLGWPTTLALLGRSLGKGTVVRLVGFLGKGDLINHWVASRRFRPPTDGERAEAEGILAYIKAVSVPGWEC